MVSTFHARARVVAWLVFCSTSAPACSNRQQMCSSPPTAAKCSARMPEPSSVCRKAQNFSWLLAAYVFQGLGGGNLASVINAHVAASQAPAKRTLATFYAWNRRWPCGLL